jgi:hypothetical protein
VQSKKLDPKRLITHSLKLDRILDAYDTFSRAADTRAVKVIIEAYWEGMESEAERDGSAKRAESPRPSDRMLAAPPDTTEAPWSNGLDLTSLRGGVAVCAVYYLVHDVVTRRRYKGSRR